jgi:hypothetical protein
MTAYRDAHSATDTRVTVLAAPLAPSYGNGKGCMVTKNQSYLDQIGQQRNIANRFAIISR